MTRALLAALLLAATPRVGDRAPDFTLPDTDGVPVTLSTLLRDGPVILAFFPKAFTPGCTRQNSALRDRYPEIVKKGARVVGISVDDVDTQRRFKAERRLPYPLLSDRGGKVAERYAGTMAVFGLARRANFVVGQDGIIVAIFEGDAAIDPGDAIRACPVRPPGAR